MHLTHCNITGRITSKKLTNSLLREWKRPCLGVIANIVLTPPTPSSFSFSSSLAPQQWTHKVSVTTVWVLHLPARSLFCCRVRLGILRPSLLLTWSDWSIRSHRQRNPCAWPLHLTFEQPRLLKWYWKDTDEKMHSLWQRGTKLPCCLQSDHLQAPLAAQVWLVKSWPLLAWLIIWPSLQKWRWS